MKIYFHFLPLPGGFTIVVVDTIEICTPATSFLRWYIVQRFQYCIRYIKFRGPRGACITVLIYESHV